MFTDLTRFFFAYVFIAGFLFSSAPATAQQSPGTFLKEECKGNGWVCKVYAPYPDSRVETYKYRGPARQVPRYVTKSQYTRPVTKARRTHTQTQDCAVIVGHGTMCRIGQGNFSLKSSTTGKTLHYNSCMSTGTNMWSCIAWQPTYNSWGMRTFCDQPGNGWWTVLVHGGPTGGLSDRPAGYP